MVDEGMRRLACAAHDMRTPAQAIAGMARLALRHENDAGRVRECLRRILAASEALLCAADDVLDAAQLEEGRIRTQEAPFSVRETAERAVELVAQQAAQKRQTLSLEREAAQEAPLLGDARRLGRVLVNLLGNAVKYTPPGGRIALRVRTERTQGGVRAEFAVEDNGIGMDEAALERAFMPFVRAKAARQSGETGAGLGLAICRALTEAMGGELRAQSRPGAGSTFVLTLTLRPAPLDDLPKEEAAPEETAVLAGKRFLIAEDHAMHADVLRELLADCGARAEWAQDGVQAVRLFAARACGHYDAVLMDLHMPDMDGFKAARAIRSMARPDARTIPIYAMTASLCQQEERLALGSGMNARLVKPVELGELAELFFREMEKIPLTEKC